MMQTFQCRGNAVCLIFSANCFFNILIISSFFVFSSIILSIELSKASFSYQSLEYSSFNFSISVVAENFSIKDSLEVWLSRTDWWLEVIYMGLEKPFLLADWSSLTILLMGIFCIRGGEKGDCFSGVWWRRLWAI